MTNAFFAFFASNADGAGDKASMAGVVTAQGMLTIFLVLALIWAAIEIMHRIIHRGQTEKKADADKSAPIAAAPMGDAAIAAAIAAALAASEDEGATVAAITAAIIAARAEEGNTTAFRVVSFKRVGRTAQKRF
jgi:Na+-transporting methylmalonyl-CoA/oxaloacetate decarboxylase gamma subunit